MKLLLFSTICFLFGFSLIAFASGPGKEKPNILVLYADDLGWSDLRCYGSRRHETPHLDNLGSEGIRFTNAYAGAPICSASRASIMTGKSPARLNFEFVSTEGHTTDRPLLPPERTLELPLDEITLGEIAKGAGYNTAFFGKWHIAKHNGSYLKWSDTHGPLQQGFQVGSDHFGSHPYDEKNRPTVHLPEGTFPSDTSVLKAIRFLKSQQQRSKPFLMFFSSYFVHTPVLPNNSWLIEKYKRKLAGASDNEIMYAAFVETMDHHVGQILRALKDLGLEKNTIVIFTSDNGGHPAFTDNAPLRGNKWNLYEGGIREPLLIRWPGQVPAKKESDVPVIQWDVLPTLCDVLGQEVPSNIDGVSLMPVMTGETSQLERKVLYWHFPYYHPPKSYEGTKPCSAIRSGRYKLIYFYEDERTELYDLENDIRERSDLSSALPALSDELKAQLFGELKEADARLPERNQNYEAKEK